jgi:hypothetical protein
MDFNTAKEQRTFDLIPAGTVAVLQINLKAGGGGDDGYLKHSKSGECSMLDCAFAVVDGPHAKRKFFGMLVVTGTTEGQQQAADIAKGRIRAMLESARGIKPSDNSDAAKTARCIGTYGDLDGLRFIGKIGIERGKDGFKDKNILEEVLTPERKEWHAVEQLPKDAAPPVAATNGSAYVPAASGQIARPSWAS